MTRFTSRAFSLVLNQVVFVLLAYNLLQVFVRTHRQPSFSRRSRPRQLDLAMTTSAVIIIYAENRFATFTPFEYTELLLTLGEEARQKVLRKTRRLREELGQALRLARAPYLARQSLCAILAELRRDPGNVHRPPGRPQPRPPNPN